MDKKWAWTVPALSGAVMLCVFFTSMGGLDGIARDPVMALSVFAIALVIAVPTLWLSYRRLLREPTVVRIEPQAAVASARGALDRPPVVLDASRLKIMVFVVVIVGLGLFGAAFLQEQTGVCRIAGSAVIVPFFAWNGVIWIWYLLSPPRLVLSPEGLNYTAAWTSRTWRWDEVRDVTVRKFFVRGVLGWFLPRQPSLFVVFKRYAPPGATSGASTGSFRAFWRMPAEELGALLTAAHAKWSTRDGRDMVPVPRSYWLYFRTAAYFAVIIGIALMFGNSPCKS